MGEKTIHFQGQSVHSVDMCKGSDTYFGYPRPTPIYLNLTSYIQGIQIRFREVKLLLKKEEKKDLGTMYIFILFYNIHDRCQFFQRRSDELTFPVLEPILPET